MSAITRTALLLCLGVAVLPAASAAPAGDAAAETTRIERLAALGRLWGTIKYFHPYLAYRDIGWDAALIAAIPKVSAAQSVQEYRDAIDGLIAVLDDPATRTEVAPAATPPRQGRRAEPSRIVDGVLVVHCLAAAEQAWNGDYNTAATAVYNYLAKQSNGVVFDCRTAGVEDPLLLFAYQFAVAALPQIFKGNVTLATYRERQHSGFVPQYGVSSGDYWSGLITMQPRRFAGQRAGEPVPLAFVVDTGTPVMAEIVGLQAANLGRIVEETGGTAVPAPSDADYSAPMPGGFSARVRNKELVSPTGEVGWKADLEVPASAGGEAAVMAAIGLLKSPPAPVGHAAVRPAPLRSLADAPYADMAAPTVEYRLLALFRFWNVIRYFFATLDLMDKDWEAMLVEFIPRFEAAESALDYQMTVAALATRLQDSHVRLENTPDLDRHLGFFAPPLTVGWLEGKFVIVALADAAAAEAAGVKVGDVVLAVDGEAVEQRVRRLAEIFVASTPQAMSFNAGLHLLRGGKDSVARLTLEGQSGTRRDAEIARSKNLWQVAAPPERSKPAAFEILPSRYGYVDLARLEFADADRAIDAVIDTPAIIFDIRGYPKGTGWAIASRLLNRDKPAVGSLVRRPLRRGSSPDSSSELVSIDDFAPSAKPRYAGKVVMLINEWAVSQAETTCMDFAAATDVTFIGSPTNGADGDVTNFALPGNIVVFFSGQEFRWPDGRRLQRVGVKPHIRVEPTIAGLREGRDEVLEAAVAYLDANSPDLTK